MRHPKDSMSLRGAESSATKQSSLLSDVENFDDKPVNSASKKFEQVSNNVNLKTVEKTAGLPRPQDLLLPRNDMGKIAAFTLAEVLITLGIIGVVAAMTLPTLINRNEEKVAVNKLKKFYSVMSQAYLMSVNDNGYANEWSVGDDYNETTANQLAKYITPYLKISKDCGTQSGCLNYVQEIKFLNGQVNKNYDTDSGFYKLILADGSYMWFRAANGQYCKKSDSGYTNTCGSIFIDVNGPKGQNTYGRDVFQFMITQNGVFPSNKDTCKKTDSGSGCASYILTHDNMDYLH